MLNIKNVFYIILLLLQLSTIIWADDTSRLRFIFSTPSTENKSLTPNPLEFNKNPSLDLETPKTLKQILFKNKDKIIRIQQKHFYDSGDDVGNGGDSIRERIIIEGNKIIQELEPILQNQLSLSLRDILNIKHIKVVENLQICLQTSCINTPFAVVENHIFLDKNAWDGPSGILNSNTDYRNLLLYLIFKALNPNTKMEDIYQYFSELSPLKGPDSKTPFCDLRILTQTADRTPYQLTIHKHPSSSQEAINQAILECQTKGLIDCYISSSGHKGVIGFTSYYAQATGYKQQIINKSTTLIKESKCQKLRSCEVTYEIAPLGQVQPQDFLLLDKLIEKNCLE